MEPTTAEPDAGTAQMRARQVKDAVNTWRGQLIDLSWRNQLLFYRDLRFGTLDLADADYLAVEQLLSKRAVTLSKLFRRQLLADRMKRARAIRNKAREAIEERGIGICYIAVGMATWRNAAGAATPAAPVLLLEAAIVATGAAEDDFELTVTGEPVVNPAFLHLLSEQFKIGLDGDDLVGLLDGPGFDPRPVFDRLLERCDSVPGLAINDRRVLGTFSYTKMPMVEDLAANLDALIRHDVVAAIAGHQPAARAIATAGTEVAIDYPDQNPPENEYLVLDADSSQSYVINSAVAGQSMVVSGPPGTGKSQTIANMIATLVAHGQSVLFVAEKRAAISAVLDRLTHTGLGELVFDVHDGGGSRAALVQTLTSGLRAQPIGPEPDHVALHQHLSTRRSRLNTHDDAMNRRRQPWSISVFDAQSALLGLDARYGDKAKTGVRLGSEEVGSFDAATMRQVREQLSEFATLGGLTLSIADSAWSGATIDAPEQSEAALRIAANIQTKTLPEAWRALDEVAQQTRLTGPKTIAAWREVLDLLADVARTIGELGADVFGAPLDDMIAATAPRRSRVATMSSDLSRRQIRSTAAALWTATDKPKRKDLHAALVRAKAAKQHWADRSPTTPRLPANLSGAIGRVDRLTAELRELGKSLAWVDFESLPRPQLVHLLAALASDERTLRKLPRLNELATEFSRLGLDPLLAEMRARRLDPELAAAAFEVCWYSSVLDSVGFEDPAIANFDGGRQDSYAAEFRADDARHIKQASARVLDRVAQRLVAVGAAEPEQSRLVAAQAARKRGHLPLRQLFGAAPDLMTALKPCWAMSPLVVSHLLPGDRPYFDVVVFDEASQIIPADAIAAISRANRVIVAGDRKQLPPTQFFAVDAEDKGEHVVNEDGSINLALTTGFESILDVLTAALSTSRARPLTWHYRSRDERLIAFSNTWVYDDSLTTFPGVAGSDCLSLDLVRRPRTVTDEDDSVAAEVDRVVTRILDHAATRPDMSLGVITMGINHMERIDRRLRERLRTKPRLRGFFDDPPGEPFFVKNLERVQGDERDSIILSIGYGKRPDGSLSHNFGPLNQEGGHRRLNVAITRARSRMTVVSSFSHLDMDPERSTAPGVAMLRGYLQYAATKGAVGARNREEVLTPFDIAVRDRLAAAGIPVVAQFGVTGHSIDFAAKHPTTPGAMVLAIESDGPHYHSSPTARDRDRLRQEQLGRLGWSYHRIWATDWFTDAEGCIARAQAAYFRAIAGTDAKPFDPGRPITDYSDGELVAVVQWINADGRQRSDDELLKDFMAELGFAKAGARIRARFDRAVRYARIR
ncbi:AAA domain-containing protein [Antrihabitans sp. YC2-6]|uniref:AAA domain-containing protein n=1 Tax=Antrihabitans sp. YC2-6 TaxID=2799498 RepID=UPI0018F310C0|nr:AAA domain-containing protein [Antrihabitans sp. YC2-6]MBJ8348417.1 DUF4011 domain-containing protein [Antrihabitans sp. YC2-6]